MTAEAGAIEQPKREVSPWRAVGLFLLLTICLSGIFWALINATQTPNPGYIWLLMWMPGVSALLTCRILGRPLRSLGWTWNWRWVLIGYLIPVAYCLVASLVTWIAGIGGFPNTDFVHQAAGLFGLWHAGLGHHRDVRRPAGDDRDDLGGRRGARRRDRLARVPGARIGEGAAFTGWRWCPD